MKEIYEAAVINDNFDYNQILNRELYFTRDIETENNFFFGKKLI